MSIYPPAYNIGDIFIIIETPGEYDAPFYNQTKTFGGKTYDTWPEGSAYPDYFFFGDPHINYYEGTAMFDDVKLYLPK